MTKTEMIAALAQRCECSKSKANTLLDGALEVITEALANGETISLPGFGSFSVGTRAARQGRNPRTGETINIAATKSVKFSAGQALKRKIAG